MTNVSYIHSPSVQIVLSGEYSGTLSAATLTVAVDGQFVTLDDTVSQFRLNPHFVRGAYGNTFVSAAQCAEYFNFLKDGGVYATAQDDCRIDIDQDANTATLSLTGNTYDVGSLTADEDANGYMDFRTLRIKQGSNVLAKGIFPHNVVIDDQRITLDVPALIDLLNETFSWDSPEERETEAKEVSDRFGYAFTGGFAGKPVENNYVWDGGAAISLAADTYTHLQFDATVQAAVDAPYWSSPVPTGNGAHIGTDVFEGIHLPDGVANLFDYTYEWADGGIGRIDVSGAKPGDLLRVRMDYNVIPSIANSVIEAALDFNTRDNDDNITFQFYLTANPSTFGNTSAGQTYLLRTEMTAYFASNEDVNALVRPVVKCNNICQIQPISILAILQK